HGTTSRPLLDSDRLTKPPGDYRHAARRPQCNFRPTGPLPRTPRVAISGIPTPFFICISRGARLIIEQVNNIYDKSPLLGMLEDSWPAPPAEAKGGQKGT